MDVYRPTVTWNLSRKGASYRNADALVFSVPKSGRTWFRVMLSKYLSLHFDEQIDIGGCGGARMPNILYGHEIWSHRMTDSLREYTEEDIELRHPRWVAPTIVYLASAEAHDISGRVIQAGGGMVAVCEGWRRGAEIEQEEDPVALGPKLREMIAKVRKNSGMDGLELD